MVEELSANRSRGGLSPVVRAPTGDVEASANLSPVVRAPTGGVEALTNLSPVVWAPTVVLLSLVGARITGDSRQVLRSSATRSNKLRVDWLFPA